MGNPVARWNVSQMKKLFATLGLLFALTACATHSMPATPQQRTAIRTIGFASLIGDQVVYQRIAYAGRGMENWSVGRTSDWGLDDFAFEQVKEKLAPSYSLVTVAVDREALKASKTPAETLRTAVKPGQPPVDAYLVLLPTNEGDFIGRYGTTLAGLGIYRSQGYSIQVYAACALLLVDAHSFTVLGGGQLAFDVGKPGFVRVLQGKLDTVELAHRKIPASLAKATTWNEFTPVQQAIIKREIESLLKDSLAYPLKGTGIAY
jgi:hypothetical protein